MFTNCWAASRSREVTSGRALRPAFRAGLNEYGGGDCRAWDQIAGSIVSSEPTAGRLDSGTALSSEPTIGRPVGDTEENRPVTVGMAVELTEVSSEPTIGSCATGRP